MPTIRVPESQVQIGIFAWAKAMEHRYPDLCSLYAVPNFGSFARQGGTNIGMKVAYRRREGMKDGVVDIHLPVARGGFIGLWIEVKTIETVITKTKPPRKVYTQPTEDQRAWLVGMAAQGHRVAIHWTTEDATRELETYLMLPRTVMVTGFHRYEAPEEPSL